MKMQYNWKPVIESLFAALESAGIIIDEVDNSGGDEDGEEDRSKMVDEATACDECNVYVRIPGETRRHALLIVLGNEPFETVADYSVHPLLDSAIEAWSASWEGKPCPQIPA